MIEFFHKYKTVIINTLAVYACAIFARFCMGLRWYLIFVCMEIIYELIFIALNFLIIRKVSFIRNIVANDSKLKDILNVPLHKYLRNLVFTLLALGLPQLLYMLMEVTWK